MMPIRLAVIGAGIFARDAHLPSLRNLAAQFEIVAVYSRTAATAQAFAAAIGPTVQVYTNLDALLLAPDIDAVDIVLPIPVMPPIVTQALASGKHVISEKPLAPNVATCRQLLAAYQRQGQVWMVAENWRYESAYVKAAALVKSGAIGKPLTCQLALYLPMLPGSKYFESRWRRSSEFTGGTLMDGGVHHISVLRMIVGEIVTVQAVATRASTVFATNDTLSATLAFANGALGSYLVTYAVGAPWAANLDVVGDRGALRVQRGGPVDTKRPNGNHSLSKV
ncbi:MAG: Gfo/Idh/MocA family oxidoreductase [Caldilineaceae bacterium]